jgi:hypothetical protein
MIISKTFKPEKCVSHPSRQRKALEHAILDGDKLVATTGRAMVVIPIERETGDRDGYVSPEALIQARKNGGKVACGDSFVLSNGASFPRNPEIESIKPYDWKQVAPKGEMSFKLGLSIDNLAMICEAMGGEQVTLEIFNSENGTPIIKVIPAKGGAWGVMMGAKT